MESKSKINQQLIPNSFKKKKKKKATTPLNEPFEPSGNKAEKSRVIHQHAGLSEEPHKYLERDS